MQNMASKDAWTALKYLLGLHIAILLTHFSYKDGPLDHWIRQKSTGVNESIALLNGRNDYFYIYKGFDTEDGMPGNGQKCEEMDRPCEKCNEGRLSCQYRSGGWKPILDDCVLQVIKDLERKAKALVVHDVSVFVAQLSNATVQHNQEITQSPVTVRTIVGILVHITDISQNITINKPVMENFLKTVDILVSDKSRETWRKLNNGNTTSNTSTELLSAIEDISSRLADDSFTINETSIELIRTVIENSYSANSKLPNSTTKILIPQVSKPTSLTIIVFTTLYNVLPTRDTRNNNSWETDVHINGDVVVIKVNETLNNISFTFDMTDPSLGNAQCVFWNFNHDTWDSTGCEVKPFIREGNEMGKIICECNHTTSFSILMSPFFIDDKALDYITFAGLGISVASLILLIIYSKIRWKFSMRHVCLVNISVCLIIADISFIIGATIVQPGEPSPVVPCSVVTFFMHVFYLAYFFWMLFLAMHLYVIKFHRLKIRPFMSRAKKIAFIVGYGVPLLIVVITVALTAGAGKYILESDVCWLNWDETKALQIFVSLALIIVAVDIFIVIKILHYVWCHQFSQFNVVLPRATISYTPLLGITWVFGIGTMLSPSYGIHVVFTVLNSLQGFFLLATELLIGSRVGEKLVSFGDFTARTEDESNIPEDIIPEDNKRASEQISLPVIRVTLQNTVLSLMNNCTRTNE